MKTGYKGIELIKKWESFQPKAYKCPAGVLTIGYGHTSAVDPDDEVTEEEATLLLRTDLIHFESDLNNLKLDLPQNKYDALIVFIYNVGFGAFSKSTLLQLIKKDPSTGKICKINSDLRQEVQKAWLDQNITETDIITLNFSKWSFAGGKFYQGLFNRRLEEAKLYWSV